MGRPLPTVPRPIPRAWPIAPIATGLAYFVASMIALRLTQGANGIATIWPSSGILVSALALSSPRHVWRHLAAAGIASLVANLLAENGLVISSAFTVVNLLESVLVVRLACGLGRAIPSLVEVRAVGRFCGAAVVGTAASASLATLASRSEHLAFWSSWFTTDLLGILVVAPVVLAAHQALGEQSCGRYRTISTAFDMIAVALVTAGVFSQSTAPLLFVSFAAVMIATQRSGPLGAAAGVTIVAIEGSVFTRNGMGPLMLGHATPTFTVLVFQSYLLVLLGTALSLAALLASRDALLKRLGESNRLLNLAERTGGVGHWRFDAKTLRVSYSPALVTLYGLPTSEPLSTDEALAVLHADDRNAVLQKLEAALRDRVPFDFTVRVRSADGEERLVHSCGTPDLSVDGTVLGLIGTGQDVTERRVAERDLIEARLRAEAAAERARIDADTDTLTGAPNRRKGLALLQSAAEACGTRRALTVAMIDIDRFKAVNDRHGHAVGDLVLMAVYERIRDSLRGTDHVARFGGEEFLAILPASSSEQARGVLERVREAVAAGGDGAIPSVTISAGLATLETGEALDALIVRADKALYAAKGGGRNRLRLAA